MDSKKRTPYGPLVSPVLRSVALAALATATVGPLSRDALAQPCTQQQKLTAGDAEAGDGFGHGVSVSGDTVMVGALNEDAGGPGAGAAYVFTRTAGVWTQQQKLTAGDAEENDGPRAVSRAIEPIRDSRTAPRFSPPRERWPSNPQELQASVDHRG